MPYYGPLPFWKPSEKLLLGCLFSNYLPQQGISHTKNRLRQYFLHDPRLLHAGQAHVQPLVLEREAFVIDT